MAVSAFNDSVGINLHLEYHNNTAWDTNYPSWSPTLLSSPVKHLRFGLCHYGLSENWCSGAYHDRFNALAAAGKTMDILTDPWMGWTVGTSGCNGNGGCLSGYLAALGLTASAVDAYEGPNECNNGGGNCDIYGTSGGNYPWPVGVLNVWSPEVFTLASSGVSIYGPGAAFCDSSQFPNLSASINALALHDYPGNANPENGDTVSCLSSARAHTGGGGTQPGVTTETGYTTGPPYTASDGPVSRLAQERYIGRQIAYRLNPTINIKRMYIYELFDDVSSHCSGSDDYQCYGLLDASYSPKPAWTRLMQLMSYFTDTGTPSLTPLTYSITGDTTGKLWQDLFQRGNGNYELVLWLATNNFVSGADVAPTNETVTLTLPVSVKKIVVTRWQDNGAVTTTTINSTNGVFSIGANSLLHAISFHV